MTIARLRAILFFFFLLFWGLILCVPQSLSLLTPSFDVCIAAVNAHLLAHSVTIFGTTASDHLSEGDTEKRGESPM